MLMLMFELHHPSSVDEAELAASLMAKNEAFDWVGERTSFRITNGVSIQSRT